MNGRLGRTCFAHALLFIFALMLVVSLLPRAGGTYPVAADLFWVPYTPQPTPTEASMSSRPSQGQAGSSLQIASAVCPPRPGPQFFLSMDFSLINGLFISLLAPPAMGAAAVPVLARYAGGRAPPRYHVSVVSST